MKALNDLGRNTDTLVMQLGLAGGGPTDELLRRHFVNFVRLVDVSIEEYESAREWLEDSDKPGGFERVSASLRTIDHLELCVITLRRTLNAMRAIVRNEDAPSIPRVTRRAIESYEETVKDARDVIVHIEEYISRGDLGSGQSHALRISDGGESASIGPHDISINRIAAILRHLHGFAADLARYREVPQ